MKLTVEIERWGLPRTKYQVQVSKEPRRFVERVVIRRGDEIVARDVAPDLAAVFAAAPDLQSRAEGAARERAELHTQVIAIAAERDALLDACRLALAALLDVADGKPSPESRKIAEVIARAELGKVQP